MKILGLTGGSGTGKSAASTAFASLGCAVIDADASYRMLCDTCTPMLEEIQSVFLDILSTDGKLDRKKLGAIVFADPQKLLQNDRDGQNDYILVKLRGGDNQFPLPCLFHHMLLQFLMLLFSHVLNTSGFSSTATCTLGSFPKRFLTSTTVWPAV